MPYDFSGLLITGGQSDDADDDPTTSAEVWLPGDQSCLLPRLPDTGWDRHTQTSYTTCIETSCFNFDGEWEQSHSLSERRKQHVSWQSPAGILLMGGQSSEAGQTSELLSSTDTTTTPYFNLRNRT